MNKELLVQALTKYLAGLAVVALLIFLSAGTFDYWNSWLFLGILFVPMLVLGVFLLMKDPELLQNASKQRRPSRNKSGSCSSAA